MLTYIPDHHIMNLAIRDVEVIENNSKHRRPRI